jgi:hypothetical protein
MTDTRSAMKPIIIRVEWSSTLKFILVIHEDLKRFQSLPQAVRSLIIEMSNSTSLAGLLLTPHGNATLIANSDLCRLTTCDLTLAHFDYLPLIGGNALFAAIFAGCFLVQLLLGFKFRTWGFMAAATIGMMTGVIGYVARLMMYSNLFNKTDFLMYLVSLPLSSVLRRISVWRGSWWYTERNEVGSGHELIQS